MQVDVTASSEAIRRALRQISVYDARTRIGLETAIHNSVKRMAYGAKSRVPRAQGTLRKSISSSFKTQTCEGKFMAKKPHAHLVEYGTKAHWVQPTKKKALRMVGLGIVRFVQRKVLIPAIPARPFMAPAYRADEPRLIAEIEDLLRRT